MEFLINLLLVAAVLVLFVNAIVEVVKRTTNLNKRFLPLVAVASGIFVSAVFYPLPFHSYDLYTMLVTGFISGLTASGTFDITKAVKELTGKRDGAA